MKTLAIQATTGNRRPQVSMLNRLSSDAFSMAVKNSSLLKNPLKGGSPAMEKLPITAIVKVIGIKLISPPSLRISRVPVR